MKGSTQVLWK